MLFLPTHKVDTPIDPHKGTGVHVANHSIVLNWEVSSRLSTTGASWMRCRALRSHFR